MRRKVATIVALMLALGAPVTVSASAGLPKLAGLELGTYHAQINGDSPSLHTGTNTITVAIDDFPADAALTLKMLGPSGQVVNVPLGQLTVLSGPSDSHDMGGATQPPTSGHDMSNMNMPSSSDHEMSHMHGTADGGQGSATENHTGHSHDAPAPAVTGHEDGHDHAEASFNVRGKAVINEPGAWRLVLEAQDHHGETLKAEASVDAEPGGPSKVYLSITGLIMAGSITYGAVNRRRQPTGGR